MSSPNGTATARNWHFILHTQAPLTADQVDTLAGLDQFADGDLGLEEGPGFSLFTCYLEAPTLTVAIADALARFEHLPGVLIRSVELSEYSLDHNGMATPAVVPWPSNASGS